jgi:hypothetical protein
MPRYDVERFGFAPRGGQWDERRRASYFGVIGIGDDKPGPLRHECVAMQWSDIKASGHGPKKPVAIFKIFGPFLITQKISTRTFDFDDDDFAFGRQTHKVCASPVAKAYLRLDHDLVAQKQP